MKYELKNNCISFYFQERELTEDIKSVFCAATADVLHHHGIAEIQHEKIAGLSAYEIKKLGLPPVYPYRMTVKTRGRPTTPAFSFEIEFIGPRSRRFYNIKRKGAVLTLDGQDFILTEPHFSFLEKLDKLTPEIKNPGDRLSLWAEVIKAAPKELVLDNKELLDFQFIKADRFCLDQKQISKQEFKTVPELIYKNNEDMDPSSQLPEIISLDFKESFLKINTVDPYYRVGNYYIQLSKPLRECLKIMKKINREPLEKRKAFYLNPMEIIKKQMPEELSEDLLEDIFFETERFKSDRILHLGKWVPKLGIYIDPDNKSPWFPKDDISIKTENGVFHLSPDDLNTLPDKLEQLKRENQDVFIYKNQSIPINDELISKIKNVRDKIIQEALKHIPPADQLSPENQKISKLVAVIKDNIDHLEYESVREKRHHLKMEIPSCLRDKFVKYPYQKEGLLWLEKNFIHGAPGALLADDMGLGKTFQALSFLYWYKKNIKDKKPILIVAPTGLLKNWQDEHEKHLLKHGGLGKKYKAYGESFRKDRNKSKQLSLKQMQEADWVLTTYESIRDHHTDFFIKVSWGVVIFDEIQKIKNPNALMTDASKALESDFSIGLTGTPVENSFIDLWCVADCLYPKILGLLKDFHNRYIKSKKETSGQEIQNRLFKKQPPFILRRIKETLLKDLPKRKTIRKKESMTKAQQEAYSEVRRKATCREYSSGLQAISLLKKISVCIQEGMENEEFIQSNAKIKLLFEILKDIKTKNEKVLIAIENKILQKRIKGICSAKWNLNVNIINGDMSGDRRQKAVHQFGETKGFNIMIISPKAGGVGLNIVSANHIIHLERWWNPAVEDQSNDRIFRIGQTRKVFVYYLLAVHPDYKEESFDIILDKLLESKRSMREKTLIPSEPNKYEKDELYRRITGGMELYLENKESFYDSPEWKNLRIKALLSYPPICMRCGNKNNIEVDHVKPRSKYPHLELKLDNLQILCGDCNCLKGAKDSLNWDFRSDSVPLRKAAGY